MNVEALLEPLISRLRLMVGRCVLTATRYKSGELLADVELIEKRRNIEFMQHYGFSSRPKGKVNGVCVFVGGSRDNGIVVATEGEEIRQSLKEGEVAVHAPFGQKILLKEDGSIEITAASGKKIVCKNDIECEMEVTCWSKTKPVKLSTHLHSNAVPGPSTPPTPGT